MPIRVSVVVAMSVVAVAILGGAPAASATEGSVPGEVEAFVAAPDGLIANLDDFLGPGVGGKGIDFDDSTEFGRVDRVFLFAPSWLAGEQIDPPVTLDNRWTVPVSVANTSIGVAIVWINPTTVRPQLADFIANPVFATALTAAPEAGYIVNDVERAAWFVLEQPRLLVLVSGNSGVGAQVPLTIYQEQLMDVPRDISNEDPPSFGSTLSVGTIVAVFLVVILVLLAPIAWRRRKADEEPDEQGEQTIEEQRPGDVDPAGE